MQLAPLFNRRKAKVIILFSRSEVLAFLIGSLHKRCVFFLSAMRLFQMYNNLSLTNILHFFFPFLFWSVAVQLYSPARPVVDTAEVFLWLMAVGTILCASYWSAWSDREATIEQEKLLKVLIIKLAFTDISCKSINLHVYSIKAEFWHTLIKRPYIRLESHPTYWKIYFSIRNGFLKRDIYATTRICMYGILFWRAIGKFKLCMDLYVNWWFCRNIYI